MRCAKSKCKRAHLAKRFESLLHWLCFVERCAVPPLAAALGFCCEGFGSVVGGCRPRNPASRCARPSPAEGLLPRARALSIFLTLTNNVCALHSPPRGSRGLPPPNPRFPLRSAFSCGGLAANSGGVCQHAIFEALAVQQLPIRPPRLLNKLSVSPRDTQTSVCVT